jgi:chemotaxis protein CheD
MLPLWNGEGLASPKYGNIAIEKLLKAMISNSSNSTDLIAKVFGGANQTFSSSEVGERNITLAKEMLNDLKIKIVAESVGGNKGRKLIYDTFSGQAYMKFLENIHTNGK